MVPVNGGESPTRGESGDGGENETVADIDAMRRRVLVRWLRDAGFGGCANDLEHGLFAPPEQIAYHIADRIESDYHEDDGPQLVWHLRDWADQHEKLTGGT